MLASKKGWTTLWGPWRSVAISLDGRVTTFEGHLLGD